MGLNRLMRILVVEDELLLAEATVEALRLEAYAVDLAADGPSAEELVSVNEYDLIVLDWTIPAPDGLELLHLWRREGRSTPILMLTGRTAIEDRVQGLDRGADDYLTKPFSLVELLARVRSLLRRPADMVPPDLEADDLRMDRGAHRVEIDGRAVELSPKEYGVLEYLLTRRDQVVTRTELIEHAWDDSFDSMSNVVDVVVHRLRRKIDGDRGERLLHTVKGAGYVLRSRRSA